MSRLPALLAVLGFLLTPTPAQASHGSWLHCVEYTVRDTDTRCSGLDRRQARKLAAVVYRRLDADWNISRAQSALCYTERAPRLWRCDIWFEDGNGNPLSVAAIIRRNGGVRIKRVDA